MIARALISKPRVLFFDEATSALDNRSQALVTQSIEKLRTTRIVALARSSAPTASSCWKVGGLSSRGIIQP
jgi:ATP-binding cassette subfamily C protein